MTICSRCGREFKRNPARPYKDCGACRSNYKHTARKAYQIVGQDVCYNTAEISRKCLPDGTEFIRTTTKGYKQHYVLSKGILCYVRVGKSYKFTREQLEEIYQWIKENQPVRPYEISEHVHGKKYGANNILDALDRSKLFTCEDQGQITVLGKL